MARSMFLESVQQARVLSIHGQELELGAQYLGAERWLVASYRVAQSHELTARQTEIIRLLADDKTIGQLAKLLDLTASSVQTHLQNARTKSGFETTHAMILWAGQIGIL